MKRPAHEQARGPRRPAAEPHAQPPRADDAAPDAQSDARFQVFAETASDAIIVIDEASNILFANAAAGRIFGYPVEELAGASLTLLMPEYLRHLHDAGLRNYVETGVRHISWRGVELPGLCRDGHEIDLEISFGEFTRGGRRYFTGIARDISERKRAERLVAAQHAVTRLLAGAAPERETTLGVLEAVCENMGWELGEFWSVDREADVLRCAATWQRGQDFREFESEVSGHTFARGTGLPGRVWEAGETAWIDDVTRDPNFPRARAAERAGLRAGFAFPVRSGSDVVGVMEFFSREPRPVDAPLDALMSSVGGQLGQLIERRRAEESLRRAEEAQRFLSEAGELLSASLDYETTLQSIARLAVPYLGDWCIVDLVEGDGRIARVAIAHRDPDRVARVWEATRGLPLDRREVAPAGTPAVIRTGRSIFFPVVTDELVSTAYVEPGLRAMVRELSLRSAMIVPLGTSERTFGAISLATAESARTYTREDLALAERLAHRAALAVENARLYREAQEVNRLKDEFLATLSHELRTPLTAILGWAGLLRTVRLDEASSAAALETIERNARSQKQLIDDLLDASRIITGKLRIELRPANLTQIVEAAVETTRPAADARGVELRPALGALATPVMGDPERLQQVVWNLLSNAVKFTPKGGRVTLELTQVGGESVLRVSDTGVGIPADFLPHVFDRFRQADASTTRAYGGLGLVLSIVRSLVELHGGSVRAESPGEGRGSTFTVRLPLASPAAGAAPDETKGGARESGATVEGGEKKLDGLRVLVVEDDPDTLLMLEKTLERHGARVIASDSAESARRAFEPGGFDAVVSDIGMPDEDGLALLRVLRERERESGTAAVPAVALTAYAREEDRAAALAAGFQKHLPKPVTPTELIDALAALTGRASKT